MTETRTYTKPLRRDFVSKPKYKRAKRAVKTIKSFTSKHMKVDKDNVRVSSGLNEVVWQNGARNPPGKVTVLMQQKGALVHVVHKDEKEYLQSLSTTKQESSDKETEEPTTSEESTEEPQETKDEDEDEDVEEGNKENESSENKQKEDKE